MKRTRVIIAGGRDFVGGEADQDAIEYCLHAIDPNGDFEVVCGEAKGADTFGKRFAEGEGIPVKSFPVDWDTHGRSAGPIRNAQMADYASEEGTGVLLAFWDGKSRGTKNMIGLAKKKGMRVFTRKYSLPNINPKKISGISNIKRER